MMFARFTTALAVVSLVVLAAATPYPTNVPPPPKTVTQIATKIVTKTELAQPATVTQPSGTCTATAPIVTVTEPASDCTTGPIQCCESIEQVSQPLRHGAVCDIDSQFAMIRRATRYLARLSWVCSVSSYRT